MGTKRKVIQLVALNKPIDVDTVATDTQLIALCDDGTMWSKDSDCSWHPIDDVPQGEIK